MCRIIWWDTGQQQYIFIIIAGMLTTFLYDACAASLRALGDTVTPLDDPGGVCDFKYRRRSVLYPGE